ncbi:MAG: zinc metalloprotease HtpX [Acidimicrobiales bacterium]
MASKSRSHRFPADKGLTARMMTTIFLLGLFYAILVAALAIFVKSLAIVIIIPMALLFAQYYASDKIALFSMHAKVVSAEEAPQLHAIVDRLCAMANMPKPRVAIATSDMPNAFATGRNQSHAVVCATTGILRRLDPQELEAVLAHELSHVAHRDVAVMTIASFLGIIAGFVTRMLLWSDMFGGFGGGGGRGRGSNNQGGGQVVLFELAALVFSAIFYFLSFLLIRALSRYRELAADRAGAILTGQPRILANALTKVTGEIGRIPTRDLRSAETFNAFFFAPALTNKKGASLGSLLSTHPSLQVRLEQLARIEAQMGKVA